jgi:ribose transport system substrate-binding protein
MFSNLSRKQLMSLSKYKKHEVNLLLDKKRNLHIGFCHFKSLLWSLVSHQAREKAERLGLHFTIITSSDAKDQVASIKELLKRKIDALLLVPAATGNAALIELVREIKAFGIPVIAIGAEIGEQAESGFIASNNALGSTQVTDYLFKTMGEKGKIAHLRGFPELQSLHLRSQALHDNLKRYPNIELVFEESLSKEALLGPLAWGRTFTEQIIDKYPAIDAIVADIDLMALGASQVIEEANLSKRIHISGFDGLPAALLAIQAGTITVNLFQYYWYIVV